MGPSQDKCEVLKTRSTRLTSTLLGSQAWSRQSSLSVFLSSSSPSTTTFISHSCGRYALLHPLATVLGMIHDSAQALNYMSLCKRHTDCELHGLIYNYLC